MARESSSMAQPTPGVALGEVLKDVLHSSGLSVLMKHPALQMGWETVVGAEITERTQVSAFKRGALEISVSSSSLMSDLRFHRQTILQELRLHVKKPYIDQIIFVLGMTQEKHDKKHDKPRSRA